MAATMLKLRTYSSFSAAEKQRLMEKQDKECISARSFLAILAYLGFLANYALRFNLSVAIVAMTNFGDHQDDLSTTTNITTTTATTITTDFHQQGTACDGQQGPGANVTNTREGEFDWDAQTQSLVLGSLFYGYTVTQLPGGWLAARVGGKPIFGLSIFFTGVLSLLTPLAARYSVRLFIAVRILQGLLEGMTFPAMHYMWGQWAPKWERSKLSAFSYAGAAMGSVVTWPIAGILCNSDFLGGWPSVFYLFGILGILWSVVWMAMVHNTPAEHPRISGNEREYIESSIRREKNPTSPWKSILTSPAVLGLCVCMFCDHWMFYILLTSLPLYLRTIHKFDITSNGLLSALPYLAMSITVSIVGRPADYIRSNGYLSTANTRRVMTTLGLIIPAVLLIACGYVECDRTLVIVLLTASVAFYGLTYGGFFINALDIAPRFAGILMGMANCIGSIPGFAAPAVVGYLTNEEQTQEQWRKIFFSNGCIVLFGCVVFNILAQGEELPWARLSEEAMEVEAVVVGGGRGRWIESKSKK